MTQAEYNISIMSNIESKIVVTGKYCGYNYWIREIKNGYFEKYYTAYVALHNGFLRQQIVHKNIKLSFDKFDEYVYVHGGCTYIGDKESVGIVSDADGLIIGWDYMHNFDKAQGEARDHLSTNYLNYTFISKQTVDEVEADVRDAIMQIEMVEGAHHA